MSNGYKKQQSSPGLSIGYVVVQLYCQMWTNIRTIFARVCTVQEIYNKAVESFNILPRQLFSLTVHIRITRYLKGCFYGPDPSLDT